jgi:hypothetical protein
MFVVVLVVAVVVIVNVALNDSKKKEPLLN